MNIYTNSFPENTPINYDMYKNMKIRCTISIYHANLDNIFNRHEFLKLAVDNQNIRDYLCYILSHKLITNIFPNIIDKESYSTYASLLNYIEYNIHKIKSILLSSLNEYKEDEYTIPFLLNKENDTIFKEQCEKIIGYQLIVANKLFLFSKLSTNTNLLKTNTNTNTNTNFNIYTNNNNHSSYFKYVYKNPNSNLSMIMNTPMELYSTKTEKQNIDIQSVVNGINQNQEKLLDFIIQYKNTPLKSSLTSIALELETIDNMMSEEIFKTPGSILSLSIKDCPEKLYAFKTHKKAFEDEKSKLDHITRDIQKSIYKNIYIETYNSTII